MSTSKTQPSAVLCIKVLGTKREYLVKSVRGSTQALMRDTSDNTSNAWKLLQHSDTIIAGVKERYKNNIQKTTPTDRDLKTWKRFFK